jgi:hypothetical protein
MRSAESLQILWKWVPQEMEKDEAAFPASSYLSRPTNGKFLFRRQSLAHIGSHFAECILPHAKSKVHFKFPLVWAINFTSYTHTLRCVVVKHFVPISCARRSIQTHICSSSESEQIFIGVFSLSLSLFAGAAFYDDTYFVPSLSVSQPRASLSNANHSNVMESSSRRSRSCIMASANMAHALQQQQLLFFLTTSTHERDVF